MRVRTDTAGVILLLMVVWIVFTGGSSGRSASGMAAGICAQWHPLDFVSRSDDPCGGAKCRSRHWSAGAITARSRSSNHRACNRFVCNSCRVEGGKTRTVEARSGVVKSRKKIRADPAVPTGPAASAARASRLGVGKHGVREQLWHGYPT